MIRIHFLIALFILAGTEHASAKPYIDNIDAEESDSLLLATAGETYAQAFLSRNYSREVSGIRLALEKVGATPLGIQVSLHEHDLMNDRPGSIIANFGNTAYDGPEGSFLLSSPVASPITLDAEERYWISVVNTQGTFRWSYTKRSKRAPGLGLTFRAVQSSADSGANWTEETGADYLLRMAVDTTDLVYPGNELVVMTELDSVAGSLRERISEAVDGDIITFDPTLSGKTIRLTGGRLIVDTTLTIDGSSLPDKITISGDKTGDGRTGDDTEIFEFEPGNEIVLDSLNLVDGYDTSKDGGGCIDSDSGLTIRNCLIANCATPDSNTRDNGGAAIYMYSGPYLILEDCTVDSNEAGDVAGQPASPGGALLIVDATSHISRCTFSNNSAGSGNYGGLGGGIYSTGFVELFQSTLYNNSTGNSSASGGGSLGPEGGGVYSSGDIHLHSCTIVGNQVGTGPSGYGGGVSTVKTVLLENTIVAENRNLATTVRGQDVSAGILDLRGVNLIGSANLSEIDGLEVGSPNLYGTFVGPMNAPLLADLGPFQKNGGSTLTMVPLEGSLVIDPVGGDIDSDFTMDQRGATRIVGEVLDIGAAEAPDYAAIRAERAERAALLSRKSILNRKAKKIKRKIKKLRRKGRITPIKRLKKKIRKFKREIRIIQQELAG